VALPAYTTTNNDRYYIPGYTPANVGYHASDRTSASPMEPELLMVEADHDLRDPAGMIVLDKVAKTSSIFPVSPACKTLRDHWAHPSTTARCPSRSVCKPPIPSKTSNICTTLFQFDQAQ